MIGDGQRGWEKPHSVARWQLDSRASYSFEQWDGPSWTSTSTSRVLREQQHDPSAREQPDNS
jgi:hypothetical protein